MSKKGGEQQEWGSAWERKDESNALQQRTVTEQAFIWAETAALGGRTQQRRQHWALIYHSLPSLQLETRWTRKGGRSGDAHRKHNTTPMLVPRRFLEYHVDFYSFAMYPNFTSFFLPDAPLCLHLAWFEGIFIWMESTELNGN